MKNRVRFLLIIAVLFIVMGNKGLLARSFFKKITQQLSAMNEKNKNCLQHFCNNFYEVEKGKFYRSQQLSESDLNYYLKKFKIKTLINLRGDNNKDWWFKEKAAAEKNKALFFSLPMSAVTIIKKEHLVELLFLYEKAPRPILVHCIGGADRTGEASALWVLSQQGKSKKEALKQLSITYGHRKFKNSAKDFFISIWEGRSWALTIYDHNNYPQYAGH